MGAQLWHHLAPWDLDPRKALLALQARYLNEKYDLPNEIAEQLQMARRLVSEYEADGDPYELLGMVRRMLTFLEGVSSRPLPDDPVQRIEIIRKMSKHTGQGTSSVLDILTVDENRDTFVACPLASDFVRDLFGTESPTPEQVEANINRAALRMELPAGEAVCFPVYEPDAQAPVGWYFIGNTVD